ncbi:T9SS type A sorting domain-containing protein [Sphingobacteriales bacterium CHB3]|nr:T9SS type A sorting domain-containing protein [Sphingobacteriales bacterium CHB3]
MTPSYKVAPNDSTLIRVIFIPLDSTTNYQATLRVISNDPDPSRDTVFVVLRGKGTSTTSVRITSHDLVPEKFLLEQNYPNPFNPSTTIRFGIPAGLSGAEPAMLTVFDVVGREVATLVNEKLSPGTYSVQFETHGLSSGIYFYRLTAGKFIDTKKMILTK